MIFTIKAVAVGLVAYGIAFLVAHIAGINPIHLTASRVGILLLSIAIGSEIVVLMAEWLRLRDHESGTAAMIFAASWFTSIYTPVAVISINAPFYAWATAQKIKPDREVLRPWVLKYFERTAWAQFLGILLLVILWCLISRTLSHPQRTNGTPDTGDSNKLHWIDAAFGIAAFLAGLIKADLRPTEFSQWIGYGCVAFLLCFLFRSFRLQRGNLDNRTLNSQVVLEKQLRVEQFVARLGAWGGLATALMISGLLLPNIARKEFNGSEQLPLPFAYTVFAMRPVFSAFVLPAVMGWILGGFVTPLLLPGSLRISKLITASVKQSAVTNLVFLILLVPFALGIGSGVTLSITAATKAPLESGSNTMLSYMDTHSSVWLQQGHWQSLGCFDLLVIAALVIWLVVYSATEAVIVCILLWITRRVRVNRAASPPIIPQSPAKNPPPAPSA